MQRLQGALVLCVFSLVLSWSQAGDASQIGLRATAVRQLQAAEAEQPWGTYRLHASTARRLLQKKYQLSPDPDNRGCWLYRATTGDTMEAIAKGLGVSLQELKESNSKNIADFSRINGRFIQICGIKNFANAEGVGGGPLQTDSPAKAAASNAPAPKAAPAPEPAAPAPAPKAAPAEPAPAPKQAPAAEAPARAPAPAPTGGRPGPGGVSLPLVGSVGNVLPIGTGGGSGVGLPIVGGLGRRML